MSAGLTKLCWGRDRKTHEEVSPLSLPPSSPSLSLSSFDAEGVDFSATITTNDFFEAFEIGSKLFSEDAFTDVV